MFTESSLFSSVTEKRLPLIKQFSKKDWLLFWCMIAGLLCVAAGLVMFLGKGDQVNASVDSLPNEATDREIFVDVSGAVAHPGIYSVKYTERVAAAIAAAGGLVELTDTTYVAESLNLAKTLSDGEKIFIPFRQSTEQLGNSPTSTETANTTTLDSLVSINNATESQLDQLPKVGTVTAQKIIKGRPYTSINELIEKKIVSSSVWAEISSLIKI